MQKCFLNEYGAIHENYRDPETSSMNIKDDFSSPPTPNRTRRFQNTLRRPCNVLDRQPLWRTEETSIHPASSFGQQFLTGSCEFQHDIDEYHPRSGKTNYTYEGKSYCLQPEGIDDDHGFGASFYV